jgi:hypothetical protein
MIIRPFSGNAFALINDSGQHHNVRRNDMTNQIGSFKPFIPQPIHDAADVNGLGFKFAIAVRVTKIVSQQNIQRVGVRSQQRRTASLISGKHRRHRFIVRGCGTQRSRNTKQKYGDQQKQWLNIHVMGEVEITFLTLRALANDKIHLSGAASGKARVDPD